MKKTFENFERAKIQPCLVNKGGQPIKKNGTKITYSDSNEAIRLVEVWDFSKICPMARCLQMQERNGKKVKIVLPCDQEWPDFQPVPDKAMS